MAIMAARENIDLECTFESDSAPLIDLSRNLLRLEDALHTMRDITRGGLASVLNEIAVASNIGIELKEGAIPNKRSKSCLRNSWVRPSLCCL
jgi:hydrogenase expression/formation protein HypE